MVCAICNKMPCICLKESKIVDADYKNPYHPDLVIMPLIRTMNEIRLSWAQREEIAWAIQNSLREYKCLMEEHNRIYNNENQGSIEE